MTDKPFGTLYIGMTNDIARRAYEHRAGQVGGFTKTYGLKQLVYYETYDDPVTAIAREKQLKKWHRDWKIDLIKKLNPMWRDFYLELNA